METKIWQTTELDHAIAEKLFGWKWIAFDGTPTRDHPDYTTGRRVRQFFSPEAMGDERWKNYWADHSGAPAKGDEPLSYAYCSSNGPAMVPHFSGDWNAVRDMEDELLRKNLFHAYVGELMKSGGNESALMRASQAKRCKAALVVLSV